jgi:hypothetical protein
MQQEAQVDSIIALDIGSVNTKAVLVARVEGAYRFIARAESATTIEAPWSDVAIGARHALEKLAAAAGRPLLDERGNLITPERPEGAGVDACVITASAAQPLRVVLAGLAGEWSLDSLRRAALGTYVTLEDQLATAGAVKRGGQTVADTRIQRIYDARPDVVCVAGGTDGGAERTVLELVEAARVVARFLETGNKPRILFAGNASLKSRITDIIGGQAELIVTDNVRPSLDVENIGPAQTELEVMYAMHKMARIPGFTAIAEWTRFPVLPSARAMGHVAQYLSAGNPAHGVLGVDVGASTTAIAAGFNGQLYTTLRSDVGTSFGGARLLDEVGWQNVARWLDFEVSEADLRAFVINKELRPSTIPQDTRELYIEQALAREAVRSTIRLARAGWPANAPRFSDTDAPRFEPVFGSGGVLSRAPRPGQAALLLLDAIEPAGVTMLVLDVYGLTTALGAAAMARSLISVQALEQGGLLSLATVVAPLGRMRFGEVVMNVKLQYENGGMIEDDVKAGSLSVLPLGPNQKAVMHLRPRSGIDIGRGSGHGGKPIEIQGSALGLIVDARGRPLTLPGDPARRRKLVESWLWDVGA